MQQSQPERDHAVLVKIKRDWNARARENAQHYIASGRDSESAEAFRASGERDLTIIFGGLEHLLHAQAYVVDIGCGIGRMDEFAAPRVKWLTGFDIADEMVAVARTRLAQLKNVDFRVTDGVRLSGIRDASVDVVFSHVVFQHVPAEILRAYLAEAHRVLVPGGHLVFQVPEFIAARPAVPPVDDSWNLRFYSEGEMRAETDRLGFFWHAAVRVPIPAATPPFNQLRVHVTKPANTGVAGT